MPFKPKNPELLAEQYRNIDELVRLDVKDQHYQRKLAAVRERKQELRARNSAICYELRPASRKSVEYVDFKNGLRFEVTYQEEAA